MYAKYKNELSCSGTVEHEIWGKIASEIKEKYSYNCGPYLCRFEMSELKHRYEDLKKFYPKDITIETKNFFDDARRAFEFSENLGKFNKFEQRCQVLKFVRNYYAYEANITVLRAAG